MKRFLCYALALLMLLTAAPMAILSVSAAGMSQDEEGYYLITNKADLVTFAEMDLDSSCAIEAIIVKTNSFLESNVHRFSFSK